MKRLSKQDKDKLLDTMKGHFEGLTGEKLTAGNIEQFGRFVHDKYDEYSIHNVMVDAIDGNQKIQELNPIMTIEIVKLIISNK